MGNVLEIHELRKKYSGKAALDHVSFSVKQGTCFGLLGPNGAGKSTTMKILTGIIKADSGSATVLDMDIIKQRTEVQKNVGYVPQEITLYDKLSAYDNLLFFGEMYGVKGNVLKERIKAVLIQTGLLDRAKDTIKSFSGGMKRRINIAAALLHEPKLLILDEPTVGIDPQSRNHIFEMIRQLKKEGISIIYSTHYMEEVEALCDDIAIIDQGRVIAQGNLDELLTQYGQKAVYLETRINIEDPSIFKYVTKYTKKHNGWILETAYPLETMEDILQEAKQQNMEIIGLEIMKPSLETVFLSLTGTSLRD